MARPGFVDRKRLANWADTRQAQGELPRLVRRLILETSEGLVELGMPAGDGVAAGGWDGSVRATEGNAWVPEGLSVWELSVNASPGVKADSDYAKRDDAPGGAATSDCTYVELILRPWTRRATWAKERRAQRKWRDVRAFGLDDLETWLESAPVTWAWLSEELGLSPYGMRSGSSWWDSWAFQVSPALTPAVVLAGRDAVVDSLITRVSEPGVVTVGGASLEETNAFVAATAVQAEASGDGRMLARLAFVNDNTTWRQLLDSPQPLVLVPFDPELAREVPGGCPHTVIVPVASSRMADLDLPPLDSADVAEALKEAGIADGRQAEQAGQLARRSLTAMRRHLADSPALHRPDWATAPVPRHTRAALLAGSWTDQSDGDQSVVGEFAGVGYEAFREKLVTLADASDPLVSLVGSTWHLVSPYDAWLLLAERLTEDDLKRFDAIVVAVIGEEDPALDIPRDERWWKATFEGKVRSNSPDLRRGLARSLALLGVHGDAITLPGGSGSALANHIVWQLLDAANEDSTGRKWASLSDVLPLLAEAGPDAFIDAVTRGLSGDAPLLATMFTDREHDALFSANSPHTQLLWAVEGLAWSPEHFGAAVELLARLVEVDPGGRLSNRPAESLAAVFCPWHPENAVDRERWFVVIDAMRRRHGDASWELLVSMLPESHGIHMPTHEPEFQGWKPARGPVLQVDYFATISDVVERCIEDAAADSGRWKNIIERFSDLPPNDRAAVVAALSDVLDDSNLLEGTSDVLWDSLREVVDRHRAFPEAKWSLPDEALAPLDDLISKVQPRSTLQRHQWLFQDHMPRLEGFSWREDRNAFETALADRRRDAVLEIESEGGLDAVRALAHSASVSWSVGLALEAARPGYDSELLEFLEAEDRVDLELAGQYYFGRFRKLGWEWLNPLLSSISESSALRKARLLLATRDVPRAWESAKKHGPEVERQYWLHFSIVGLGHDFPYVDHVVTQLQTVGRYAVSLDFLVMYQGRGPDSPSRDAELVAEALEGLLRAADDAELRSLSSYEYEQAFALLEANRERLGVDRVASLEWAFLPALGFDPDVPALHEGMAQNPELFVEIVCAVFRPRDDSGSGVESEDTTGQREARARNSYRLLSSWSEPPGLIGDQLDADELRSWLDEAERLLRDRGRLEVGRMQIGSVLATAPADPDGSWPPRVVGDFLQEAGNEEIERGFVTKILNSRGVTSRGPGDGGAQEIALAERYQADAERFADEWPRVASLLRSVAGSYEADAKRNEDSAERFRRGLE